MSCIELEVEENVNGLMFQVFLLPFKLLTRTNHTIAAEIARVSKPEDLVKLVLAMRLLRLLGLMDCMQIYPIRLVAECITMQCTSFFTERQEYAKGHAKLKHKAKGSSKERLPSLIFRSPTS